MEAGPMPSYTFSTDFMFAVLTPAATVPIPAEVWREEI
jgi:hypothetical protein